MKSNTSSNKSVSKLPVTQAQWTVVAEKASGSPRSATAKEKTARASAVVVKSGGYAAVREALVKKRQGQRGPQRSPTKLPVTVRYNPEVIAYFKSTGNGWQTRMNDALSEWVSLRQPA
jgi:uncharacterized protein (DUF4415 family)